MSRFGHLEFEDRQTRQKQPELPSHTGTAIQTADSLLERANDEYRWGRFEMALRLFTRCLEEDRTRVRAWVGQVQMLVQLQEHHEARMWADKALELFRNNGELLAAKAQACARVGDKRPAYVCSDLSMQASGSSPYRWQVRGEVLLASKEKTFDACFKRSLAEPEADWFDRDVIASTYLYYGKAASALDFASQAAEMHPQSGYAWFILGLCQKQLGLPKPTVRTSFEKCLQLRGDYVEARHALVALDSESLLRRLMHRLGRG